MRWLSLYKKTFHWPTPSTIANVSKNHSAQCDYCKIPVEIKANLSAKSCQSWLQPPSLNPLLQPNCPFSNAADSLGAHVLSPSTPHSADLDRFCLLNLPLSYSLTILRPPLKASSILICHPPSSLLWCGTLGDDIHVNGPTDKGPFTQAGLIPSPYFSTDVQVERKRDSCFGLLPLGPFL